MIESTPWVFVHQEYPKTLHRPDGSTCLVQDDAERDAKLAEGWNLRPGPAPVLADVAGDEAPPVKRRRR